MFPGAVAVVRPDHECAWSRRRESQLSRVDGQFIGWGLCLAVVESASRSLALPLTVAESSAAEHEGSDQALMLGPWPGNIHDGCIVTFDADEPRLMQALVAATLELHEFYAGAPLDSRCTALLHARLTPDTTVLLRTSRGATTIKQHAYNAGWWARLTTRFQTLSLDT
jgi:hypothetical protein